MVFSQVVLNNDSRRLGLLSNGIKNVCLDFLIHFLQSSFLLRSVCIHSEYVRKDSHHYVQSGSNGTFYFIFYILSHFTNNLHKNHKLVKPTLLGI